MVARTSRRRLLAVAVIAVTVAFVTGSVLLLDAGASQTTGLAAEYDATTSARYTAGNRVVDPDAAGSTFAVARVQVANATRMAVTPAGPPPDWWPENATGVAVDGTTAPVTLGGVDAATRGHYRTAAASMPLPAEWYLVNATTLRTLGRTGTLALADAHGPDTHRLSTPLQAVLVFFTQGSRQLLRTFGVAIAGAGVLVGLIVFSVVRLRVLDRKHVIFTERATGRPPRALLADHVTDAVALLLPGLLAGFALGTILVHAATNAAIALGAPLSLTPAFTPQTALLVAGTYLAFCLVAALAGGLAVRPFVRCPPVALTRPGAPHSLSRTPQHHSHGTESGRFAGLRERLSTRVLAPGALVPTVASLVVFAVFAVMVVAAVAAVGPLFAGGTTTMTQPGTPHPVASQVPAAYADVLATGDRQASPEILAFSVVGGEPFVTRGVNFTRYAAVTGATLTAGTHPNATHQAVVGEDLAARLRLTPPARIAVGGSTRETLAIVDVVGTFDAPGPGDDQLLVSLPTARRLTGTPAGHVTLVRLTDPPAPRTPGPAVRVVAVTPQSTPVATADLRARVTLRNLAGTPRTHAVTVTAGSHDASRTVRVGAYRTHTTTVALPALPAGEYTLRAGNASTPIAVRRPDALQLAGLPARVPANSSPLIRVQTVTGTPVPNATVRVGEWRTATGDAGRARVRFGPPGQARVQVVAGNRTARQAVSVLGNLDEPLSVGLRVTPREASILTRPTARVTARNPWNHTLTRTLVLDTPRREYERRVSVPPGGTRQFTVDLPRYGAGTHALRVHGNGSVRANATLRVERNDRLASAVAASGRQVQGTGLGQAVAVAVGNLEVLAGVLVLLAALMTIGSLVAAFAQAVARRRRTLGVYRATGATPRRLLALLLGDALRLGVPAAVLSVLLGWGLVRAAASRGWLVVYGVELTARFDPLVLGLVAGTAVFLICGSVALVALAVLHTAPAALLADSPRGGRTE